MAANPYLTQEEQDKLFNKVNSKIKRRPVVERVLIVV
jgi:hypothetical protein